MWLAVSCASPSSLMCGWSDNIESKCVDEMMNSVYTTDAVFGGWDFDVC